MCVSTMEVLWKEAERRLFWRHRMTPSTRDGPAGPYFHSQLMTAGDDDDDILYVEWGEGKRRTVYKTHNGPLGCCNYNMVAT